MVDDDKVLCSGKHYAGDNAPGSSMPTNRKITFKDKKVSETSSLPSSPVWTSTDGWIVRRASVCLETCTIDWIS